MLKITETMITTRLDEIEITLYDKEKDQGNSLFLKLKEKPWYETGPEYKLSIHNNIKDGGERKTILQRGNKEELKELKTQLEKRLKKYFSDLKNI
jgi:CRISPR/Cas system-associated endonuclease/helicase Cas3